MPSKMTTAVVEQFGKRSSVRVSFPMMERVFMSILPARQKSALKPLSGYKRKGTREPSGKYSGNEHKLQKRPEWQGRRRPAANRQMLTSRAYVRREKPDQQQRQAGRGDGRDRGDE